MHKLKIITIFLLFSFIKVFPPTQQIPPMKIFITRNLNLPFDYENIAEGKFNLYYELASNFDFDRQTIIFFYDDTQQQYGQPGQVDDLAKRYHFF